MRIRQPSFPYRALTVLFLLLWLGFSQPSEAAGRLSACCKLWALFGRTLTALRNSFRKPVPPAPIVLPLHGDLLPGETPVIPTSKFFEVTELVEDPEAKGHFLYHVRRKPGAKRSDTGLEGGEAFEAFVRRYPTIAALYGIRLIMIQGVPHFEYPAMEGLNARIEKLGSGLRYWRDTGTGDTDQIVMARVLAARNEMVLSSHATDGHGHSYHFHDMFVHFIGYEVIPEPFHEATRQRLKLLLALYDSPVLGGATKLRSVVEGWIREEITELDSTSNLVQLDLAKMVPAPASGLDWPMLNLASKLKPLAGGKKKFEVLLDDGWGLSRAQRNEVQKIIDGTKVEAVPDTLEHAKRIAAQYRALSP